MIFGRHFICPYCFDAVKLNAVRFRCDAGPRWCPPEPDEKYAQFWDLPAAPMGHAFTPSAAERRRAAWQWRILRRAECDLCHRQSGTRICPHCHGKLVSFTGECKSLILGIIGAKEAGKSHYITTLIHELGHGVGAQLGCFLNAANDETIHRYERDFSEPLYGRKQTLPASRPAAVDSRMRQPLTYDLRFLGTHWWSELMPWVRRRPAALKALRRLGLDAGSDAVLNDVVMSFFDTAGESLDAEDTLRLDNKYIYTSNGLILLLDPLQLEPVRAKLAGRIPLPTVNTDTEQIIARVANLIRNARGYSAGKLNVPIALAFSKCDALDALIPPGHVVHRAAWYDQGFDLRQYAEVRQAAEKLLGEWGADALVNQLNAHFETFGFFFVSSLGCSPDGDGRIPFLQPRRIAEPLLWLLAVNGVIKSVSET